MFIMWHNFIWQILLTMCNSSIVSLGAVITIVALAVGPFFQQSVSFYNHKVPDRSSEAWASSAFAYSGNAGNRGGEPGMFGCEHFDVNNGPLTSGFRRRTAFQYEECHTDWPPLFRDVVSPTTAIRVPEWELHLGSLQYAGYWFAML